MTAMGFVARQPRAAAKPEAAAETPLQRLRRLESSLTDDTQGAIAYSDAQGEADIRTLTRIGMAAAILSSAVLGWIALA